MEKSGGDLLGEGLLGAVEKEEVREMERWVDCAPRGGNAPPRGGILPRGGWGAVPPLGLVVTCDRTANPAAPLWRTCCWVGSGRTWRERREGAFRTGWRDGGCPSPTWRSRRRRETRCLGEVPEAGGRLPSGTVGLFCSLGTLEEVEGGPPRSRALPLARRNSRQPKL